MFATLRTLITGASIRAEEGLRDHFSIELIEQKIREATDNSKAAKATLASLIQRERAETRQVELLKERIEDLMNRAAEAMEKGRDDLAQEAAEAVASMENELELRNDTLRRLETRILQLRQSLERAHRRLVDLRQGLVAARAVRSEQALQTRLTRSTSGVNPMDEAEELIERVMKRDDPFEHSEILREIEHGLDNQGVAEKMAAAGIGQATKSTADDVMTRLKARKSK